MGFRFAARFTQFRHGILADSIEISRDSREELLFLSRYALADQTRHRQRHWQSVIRVRRVVDIDRPFTTTLAFM